jgi:hypothetical protein
LKENKQRQELETSIKAQVDATKVNNICQTNPSFETKKNMFRKRCGQLSKKACRRYAAPGGIKLIKLCLNDYLQIVATDNSIAGSANHRVESAPEHFLSCMIGDVLPLCLYLILFSVTLSSG